MPAVAKPGKSYKAKRPTRDEFELEELADQLTEAKNEEIEVALIVWGMDETVCGTIMEMDSRTTLVHVYRHGETIKVPFLDIMRVSNPM
ncbi:YolD-like family protein [Cohnella sp.]|uniref:YolD-like family protein n=1 Tax=Cohnella sp. TaxID=1883426 RepID=UPI0035673094